MGHTLSVTPGTNFGVLSAGGAGTFTVDQVVITGGNASGRGGGIEAGNLIVSNSVINDNQAQNSGGGIAAENVTVTASTISGNMSNEPVNNGGGGIYASESVTVDHSTISNNTTFGNGGGGIFGGTVKLTASTISGNAGGAGGGINAVTLTAINSTIADNNPVAMDGPMGAFYVGGQATLIFSTVAGNGSTQMVAGLFETPVPLTMIGSVVTDAISFGAGSQNCASLVANSTNSLEGSRESNWTCGLDINVREVGLGPLGNNGGPTETMMPPSQWYYSAYDDLGTGVTTDQRGVPRPTGYFTLGSVQSSTQPPYAFQGFLYPLKTKGWNRIAAGQKVKLNWRLRDGATSRLVKDPKTKTWASYVPVDCRSGDAAPAEIPRAAVGPEVQWLKGTRQFLFRWQAPDLAGRCVRLDLSLADGSTHQARFRIKGRRTSL